MKEYLPVIYLGVLVTLLSAISIVIFIQIIKTRRLENRFNNLQKKLEKEKGTAQEYYEFGSLYLDKKLFVQSINLFQKALKVASDIEVENKALIYNAMGYAYFAQEQYDLAIRNYKEAIKLYPEYIIALNNLANVYERKQLLSQALEVYEQVLKIEDNNATAKKRAESLRKRFIPSK